MCIYILYICIIYVYMCVYIYVYKYIYYIIYYMRFLLPCASCRDPATKWDAWAPDYILYIIYYILYIYTDYDRDGNDHVCDVYIAWWMYIASVHSVSHTIHHSVFIIFYERSPLDPQPRPSCNFWTPILARAASRLKSRLAQNAPTSPLQLESNGKKCNGHTHA